jgi:hypothetical protein
MERGEERREVAVDRLHLQLHPVHEARARRARPLEGVELADRALVLDDEADRVGVGALRRVAQARRNRYTSPSRIGILYGGVPCSGQIQRSMSPAIW